MLQLWALACLGLALFPAASPEAEASTRAPVDRQAAQLIRNWLADSDAPTTAAQTLHPTLRDWQTYVSLEALDQPEREQALRRLLEQTDSELLKRVVLAAFSVDPSYQSRQAEFIRRYGFYANWFNRLTYTAGRIVQGNVQALLQLGVDAVHQVTAPPVAGPLERRIYDLKVEAIESGKPAQGEDLQALEEAVDYARALEDLERAQWLIDAGMPEAAVFYGRQAALLRPDWSEPIELIQRAESLSAEKRRHRLASEQVGYPDRPAQIDVSAEAMRALFAPDPENREDTLSAPNEPMVQMLTQLPDRVTSPGGAGWSTAFREWAEILKNASAMPPEQRQWAAATTQSPLQNPDMQLARAESQRRGNVFKYIAWGPEKRRERLYKSATWATHAYDTLGSIGFFYVFEVMVRSVRAVVVNPVPEEELIEAQARWLARAPHPPDEESRRRARGLAENYRERRRYDDARRVLDRFGELDAEAARRLDHAEAEYLVALARELEDASARKQLFDRAQHLDPSKKIDRESAKKRRAEERAGPFSIGWEQLQLWTQSPPPCGLPGQATWFDGSDQNGEIMNRPVRLERVEDGRIRCNYSVLWEGEHRVHEAMIPADSIPAELLAWLDWQAGELAETDEILDDLGEVDLPMALEGSAGGSGLSLFPRLKPIEPDSKEIELYR